MNKKFDKQDVRFVERMLYSGTGISDRTFLNHVLMKKMFGHLSLYPSIYTLERWYWFGVKFPVLRMRMSSKLDRIATGQRELKVEMNKRFDKQDAKIDVRFDNQDTRLDARFDARFDRQDARSDARFDKQPDKLDHIFPHYCRWYCYFSRLRLLHHL